MKKISIAFIGTIFVIAYACGEQAQPDNNGSEPRLCGNGVLDPGEECDGANLGGMTCEDLGYYGGLLACKDECVLDISGCHYCGDDIVQEEYGEKCDDGVNDGIYGCMPDCSDFAPVYCGDGIIQEEHGEQCEGDDFGGLRCEDLGFVEGFLTCTEDCRLDSSGCVSCTENRKVCDGSCVNLFSCFEHCGECGLKCFPGQKCSDGNCTGHSALSPEELYEALQEKNFLLINVRDPPSGIIPGTDEVVSDETPDLLVELIGPDLHSRVVVYCNTNPRSINAIEQLALRGYSGICYLRGGVEGWLNAGYGLE